VIDDTGRDALRRSEIGVERDPLAYSDHGPGRCYHHGDEAGTTVDGNEGPGIAAHQQEGQNGPAEGGYAETQGELRWHSAG